MTDAIDPTERADVTPRSAVAATLTVTLRSSAATRESEQPAPMHPRPALRPCPDGDDLPAHASDDGRAHRLRPRLRGRGRRRGRAGAPGGGAALGRGGRAVAPAGALDGGATRDRVRKEAGPVSDHHRSPSPTVLAAARAYAAGGLCVVPVPPDGTKRPRGRWRRFQAAPPTDAQLAAWFARGRDGVAVLGGRVSGGLEVLDFDEAALFAPWAALVAAAAPGLLARLPVVRTPGPGYHVYLRCPGHAAGNQKLALGAGPGGRPVTLIETRGEGGVVLTPACPPACHPSGRPYVLERGDLAAVPVGHARGAGAAARRRPVALPVRGAPLRRRRRARGDAPGPRAAGRARLGHQRRPPPRRPLQRGGLLAGHPGAPRLALRAHRRGGGGPLAPARARRGRAGRPPPTTPAPACCTSSAATPRPSSPGGATPSSPPTPCSPSAATSGPPPAPCGTRRGARRARPGRRTRRRRGRARS